jgi:hypothetical protein
VRAGSPPLKPGLSFDPGLNLSLCLSLSLSLNPNLSLSLNPNLSPSLNPNLSPSLSPNLSPRHGPNLSPSLSPSLAGPEVCTRSQPVSHSDSMCARQVWAQAAGTGEGVWRPDPRDPVDAWLVAAAAVCRTLRRAVEEP